MSFILIVAMLLAMDGAPVNAVSTRSSAVSYMTSMASQIWMPNGNLTIYSYTHYSGQKYRGIPYAQAWVTPMYTNSTISSDTGFINKMTYAGGYYHLSSSSTGNDCCDSVLMAWRSCGFSIPGNTADSWSSYSLGKKAVDYRTNTSGIRLIGQSYFGSGNDAAAVISNTTSANAYLAYDMLQAGDAVVHDGHVMMVLSINTSQDYVTVIDQYSPGQVPGGSAFTSSSWHLSTNVNYALLYAKQYIPVAIF
jgi:hypothetical protein